MSVIWELRRLIYYLFFILQMVVKHVLFTDVMKIGGHGIGFSYIVG